MEKRRRYGLGLLVREARRENTSRVYIFAACVYWGSCLQYNNLRASQVLPIGAHCDGPAGFGSTMAGY